MIETETTTPKTFAEQVQLAEEMFRSSVEEITDPSDSALPVLLACDQSDQVTVMMLAMDVGPGGMRYMLDSVLNGYIKESGRPKWLILTVEAYVKVVPTEEDTRRLEPGELQRRARAGEDIEECIMVQALHVDGTDISKTIRFKRDGQTCTWGDETPKPEGKNQGAIPDAMRSALGI